MRQQLGKDKILQAALKLFAKQGFHKTSINQIAVSAKVSKGLAYNYFSSKEELLLAIINQASGEMSEVANSMEPGINYEITLKGFLDQYFNFIKTNKSYLTFQLSLLFQPDLKSIVEAPLQKRGEQLLKKTAAMFRNARVDKPDYQARRIISELDGITLHYLSVFKDYPLYEMKEQLFLNYKDLQR